MPVSQSKLYACVERNNHVVPFYNVMGMRVLEVLGGQNVIELGIHITISYITCKAIGVFMKTMTMLEAIVFMGK
ncbi:hypothetical protein DL768_007823 [Monosporascus sp. mg162]|nr:hypothetical protein DL768_007823 [Monosporascus sp. mg162]